MLRLAGLTGLWLICLFVALAGGWAAMWTLVYALAALVAGSFFWATVSVQGLELRRRHRPARVQVGDVLVEQAVLEVQPGLARWWPRLWLEVRDGTDLPGHRLEQVVSLGPLGRRVWELRSTCVRRGRFSLGPSWVTGGDPFGLFRAHARLVGGQTVIVYPRTVDLRRLGQVPGELPGGTLQGSRVPFATPNVASIRDYRPGDPFNRIHWPTTARTGRLMVREFELDPSADVWVVLDLDAEVQVGMAPESTEECAVTVAASLARHYLERDRAVGLVTQVATLPADRGPRQVVRILELLAVARASRHLALDGLLVAETSRFSRSSTLVVVTATTSERWAAFCHMLEARGIHAAAVLVEAATFGSAPAPLLLLSSLVAAHIPVYLVRRGVPIEQALAMPQGSAPRHGL